MHAGCGSVAWNYRRLWVVRAMWVLSWAAATMWAVPAHAADGSDASGVVASSHSRVVDRGLTRLVELRDARTGAFGGSYRVASTSLAGLALLASGNHVNRGPHGVAVRGAVDYLLDVVMQQPRPGLRFFAGSENQGKMHAHGFAMLFLAQVYGQSYRDVEIHDALAAAIVTTALAQTTRGGWGYHLRSDPGWGDDEASVTITQIQALRAARNAGFYVDKAVIDKAVGYVKASMTREGACRYSLTMQGAEAKRASFELTAAAVATLNASGVYHSEELALGLRYLATQAAKYKTPDRACTDFYFYGNLYAAQAMFQAGDDQWSMWNSVVRKRLADKQLSSGGWTSPRHFGEAYATAVALLVLQLPKGYLPILER